MSGKHVKGKKVLRVAISKVFQASCYQGFVTSFSSVKRVVKMLKKNMIDSSMLIILCGLLWLNTTDVKMVIDRSDPAK